MRIGIIGCGLIGAKRAKALGSHQLTSCADNNFPRAQALAAQFPACIPTADWRQCATSEKVDAVIVSTTNDMLVPASLAAVGAGKHVLAEKPGARSACQNVSLVAVASNAGSEAWHACSR